MLYGHLRDDWIRHKRGIRVDQISRPAEIKTLPETDQKVFDQMVLQRSAESIAKILALDLSTVLQAQARVSHELMAHDNLFLVLNNPVLTIKNQNENKIRLASENLFPNQIYGFQVIGITESGALKPVGKLRFKTVQE